MSELVAALAGTFVGAVLSFLFSLATRRQQRSDLSEALDRQVTIDLTQALADHREVLANPSSNLDRRGAVQSRLESALATFQASVRRDGVEVIVEYVERAITTMRTDANFASDERHLRTLVNVPLLSWIAEDADWPSGWFYNRLTRAGLTISTEDVEPKNVRRGLAPLAPSPRRTK